MLSRKTTSLFFRRRRAPSEPLDHEPDREATQAVTSRIMAKFAKQGRQHDDPTPPTVLPDQQAESPERHGTQRLQAHREETLTEYPAHEKACLKVLRDQGLPAQSEDIVGAAEMLLTEDHMIVRFDAHVIDPRDNRHHRYLVDIDMSHGRLHDCTLTPLGAVER